MLNARLAHTTLFCIHDINAIIEWMDSRISAIMSETGNGALSENQLETALSEGIEIYLHDAVNDMREPQE